MAFQPKASCYGIPSAETSSKNQVAVDSRQSIGRCLLWMQFGAAVAASLC